MFITSKWFRKCLFFWRQIFACLLVLYHLLAFPAASLSFVSVYALPHMHFIVTSWVASRQQVQWESTLHGAFRGISTAGHFSNGCLGKPQPKS